MVLCKSGVVEQGANMIMLAQILYIKCMLNNKYKRRIADD